MGRALTLTIPGEPMAKARPKFVRATGRTYTDQKTVNYETLVRQLYATHHPGVMLEGMIEARIRAYFGVPKSVSKRKREAMLAGEIRPTKRPDWDNLGKIVCDSLNAVAYLDDAQVVECQVGKWYGEQPRVEIELEEVGPGG